MLKLPSIKSNIIRSFLLLIMVFTTTSFQVAIPFSQLPRAKVVGVRDGDTIDIITIDKFPITIRLDGIDCPEKKQAFGERAKQFTSNFAFGQFVRIKSRGKDGFGRILAEVFNEKGVSLNKSLLRNGLAWHYVQYSKSAEFASLQEKAKTSKVGLWADKAPIAPWEFRKQPKK